MGSKFGAGIQEIGHNADTVIRLNFILPTSKSNIIYERGPHLHVCMMQINASEI